ncbi:MAG: purine-nucleoside phosphorylase [Acidimicrobiales bacterium]
MQPEASPFHAADVDARRLADLTGCPSHDVAVVLGSGWTSAIDALGAPAAEVAYGDLSGFPVPTVAGHGGSARSLEVGKQRVLLLSGRVHLYEGHGPGAVVHAVRTAIYAGCTVVVLTNSSGSLRPELPAGTPVLIRDQLNLTGHNPLAGPAVENRFCDLTDAYSARLRTLARGVDPSLPEGVYAGLLGPSYETPVEVRMLQSLGADLVGMSTVLETIAARHLGAEVLGLALVTNLAAGLQDRPLAHAEVLEASADAGERIGTLVRRIVEAL